MDDKLYRKILDDIDEIEDENLVEAVRWAARAILSVENGDADEALKMLRHSMDRLNKFVAAWKQSQDGGTARLA